MGGVYQALGLTVAVVQQGQPPGRARAGFDADVTYLTANALGFSYLTDTSSVMRPDHLVRGGFFANACAHPSFHTADTLNGLCASCFACRPPA